MKRLLKLFIVAILGMVAMPATASHIIGGDIYYKYIGDQTGVANQYEITMIIYREGTGANLTTPLLTDLNITDIRIEGINCSYSQQLQMHLVQPEFPASQLGAFDCILPGANLPDPRVNIYRDTIVINSPCDQFKIWLLGCCRPNNYTNIQNGGNFYFEAELNRRLGNNSSPNFLNTPVNYACKDAYQIYQQNAVEPDGDSILYELVPAKQTNANNVVYNAPWTYTSPISCDPQFPFDLHPGTGTLTFQSNAPTDEVSTFSIVAREFRYDSLYGLWDQVGFCSREIQLVVRQSCRPAVNAGVRLDPTAPGVYLDPDGTQVKDYNCGDTSVTLSFTLPIECFSVAPDGTDFRLTGPNGQPLPIASATPTCDVNFETDDIKLQLYRPLIFNGDYFLYTKVGTDGNTLLNKCGKSMEEFDTIILRVSGCTDPIYNLENVTVTDDTHNFVQWSIDTLTLPKAYVDFLRIQRSSDEGLTFNQIGTAGVNDSGYTDIGVTGADVDARSYRYRVEIVAVGTPLPLTRSIRSINLQGSYNQNTGEVPMKWWSYDGWSNPEYHVELGVEGSTPGEFDWSEVNDAGELPTTDTSYTFSAGAAGLDQGTYALRVKTTPSNGYESESNWIIFGIPGDPPIPPQQPVTLRIPNMFTPGPDQFNPRWTIDGIEAYSSVVVKIYDRWGHSVFQSDNYTNGNAWEGKTSNGQDVADGTYFYVIVATGGPNGDSVEEHGSITVVRD